MPRNTIKRRLKEPVLDEHVQASISAVENYHPETGHYGELHYTGCATRERAKEIVQGLHRAARRIGVSVFTEIQAAPDGTFTVVYTAVNKAHARAYVLKTYGKDVTRWPYSPRKGDANYGV